MAKFDPSIRHAITPVTFEAENKIRRDRLVDAIHREIGRKLIVIAAPAGYGKTTLLAEFSADTEIPHCWVRLGEPDRDVMRLATVLLASLERRFRRLRNVLDLKALAGSSPEAIATAFSGLIDEHIGEAFAILVDDVHLINASTPALAFLDAFFDRQPDQVTVIACGREVVEVSLAKLMAEGGLVGLGPHDLALTRNEIHALAMTRSGVELTDAQTDRLLDETRGWITGLILSSTIGQGDFQSLVNSQTPMPMVYQYLASVVLNRQPDDLRRFMLDAAVMPVMTAEACDQVLGRQDSSGNLEQILRQGLFVTATDSGSRSFEFHPLFRQFLLDTNRAMDPERMAALQAAAAEYMQANDAIDDAVHLYLEAGMLDEAGELAGQWAQQMKMAGRTLTLSEWLGRFRQEGKVIPALHLAVAGAYVDQGKYEDAESLLQVLEEDYLDGMHNSELAVLHGLRAWLAYWRGSFDQAIDVAKSAQSWAQEAGDRVAESLALRAFSLSVLRAGQELGLAEALAERCVGLLETVDEPHTLAKALQTLVTIQGALGKVVQATVNSERAHDILVEIGSPLSLAYSYNNLAVMSHMNGSYEEALDRFSEGLRAAKQAASPSVEAVIYLGQADLFNDLGLFLQAAELYGEALKITTRIENLELTRYACIQTSVLHRRGGGGALAHEWLKRALDMEAKLPASAMAQVQLAALEARLKPAQALARLQALLSGEAQLEAAERILALYFASCCARALSDDDQAVGFMGHALELAGVHNAEQVLAAELAFDPESLEFCKRELRRIPTLAVILSRIEIKRAVAQHYLTPAASEPEDHLIRVQALGKAEVLGLDADDEAFKPQVRELLFYLVDHGQANRLDVMERFWPDHADGRRHANLHMAVYSLRRVLGKDTVRLDGQVYRLSEELRFEYDVERFETAARVAEGLPKGDPRRLFALTEAISLYAGAYLPEFDTDWVVERRRNLEMRYLDLIGRHADEALMRGQPSRALGTLRQALQVDPYRDDLNRRYLEILAQLGRRSDAVAHYQRYVNLLSSELGLDPPEEISRLYREVIG